MRPRRHEEEEEDRRQDQGRNQVGRVAEKLDGHRPGVAERKPHGRAPRASSASSSVTARTSSSSSGTPRPDEPVERHPGVGGEDPQVGAVPLGSGNVEPGGRPEPDERHPRLGLHLGDRPLGDDHPALDQDDAIGERLGLGQVMRGQEHGAAVPRGALERPPRRPSVPRCRAPWSARRAPRAADCPRRRAPLRVAGARRRRGRRSAAQPASRARTSRSEPRPRAGSRSAPVRARRSPARGASPETPSPAA